MERKEPLDNKESTTADDGTDYKYEDINGTDFEDYEIDDTEGSANSSAALPANHIRSTFYEDISN